MMKSPSSLKSTSSLKFVVRAAALAALTLAPVAGFASTLPHFAQMHSFLGGKEKSVHFSLRNQSGAAVELRAGEKTMTLAAGQTMEMKLPVGTRIVTATKTEKREAGSMICEVSAAIADATVVLN